LLLPSVMSIIIALLHNSQRIATPPIDGFFSIHWSRKFKKSIVVSSHMPSNLSDSSGHVYVRFTPWLHTVFFHVAPHYIFSWSSHTSRKISHNVASSLILALIAQVIMSHCLCRFHSLIIQKPLAKISPRFYNIRCLIHNSHHWQVFFFSLTISLKLFSRKRTPQEKHFFSLFFNKKNQHMIFFSLSRHFFSHKKNKIKGFNFFFNHFLFFFNAPNNMKNLIY
jgi:hypothetical protein